MLSVGIDVGSTTVKCVVLDESNNVLYKKYERHEARQLKKVYEILGEIEDKFGKNFNLFMTGSGATQISEILGSVFVQEVNAVSLAVENLVDSVNSVVELGGQDAKMIIWVKSRGHRFKVTSMNDKCAGGTGATIDRIISKLKIPSERAVKITYDPKKVHPIAAKCGVFAETDINSLQKVGVPEDELLISLFDAIVIQNLSILTRGYTLRPKVLLLGGPNTFFPALVGAWKYHLQRIWKEKNIEFDENSVFLPKDSELFAAIGAAMFKEFENSPYLGKDRLLDFMRGRGEEFKKKTGILGLLKEGEDLEEFKRRYSVKPVQDRRFSKGETVRAYLGIDGGSTSTKAVLIDEEAQIIAAAYRLSSGNPLNDVKQIVESLREKVEKDGAKLEIIGVGVTGYAKDMLKDTIGADVAVVETVAHATSAKHFFQDIDVLVDVGGQDIKIMFMSNGRVNDFRLNTQCSAGNGFYLQATAERFGYKVTEYADVAFKAKYAPNFNFGCAVFLEQDIVNFQRLGWQPHEIMAGLAKVLPKNIWLYVVKEPNLRRFGKKFLLQGGTNRNLAAVKAQHDFIKERVPDAQIFVHPFTGEAGAFGAAVEAMKVMKGKEKSNFIGLDRLKSLKFKVKSDESTRCSYCTNRCLRTFIEVNTTDGRRKLYIIAPCEKGMAQSREEMLKVAKRLKEIKEKNPNMQEICSREVFKVPDVKVVGGSFKGFSIFRKKNPLEARASLKVGIPRALNMYSLAPFFLGYLKALGVQKFIFSPYTNEKMVKFDMVGGAIDPCFPSKISLAHVVNLIRLKPDVIFFPKVLALRTFLKDVEASKACPTVIATPQTVRNILTKEEDVFESNGITYLDPFVDFSDQELLKLQMYEAFKDILKLNRYESDKAVEVGLKALDEYERKIRKLGRQILEQAEREGKVVILVLSRPYHNDPGINHGIAEELQKRGYPILTIDSLPLDEDFLGKVFTDRDPFSIKDVWKKAYSENTNRKVWAALYAARHPNMAVLDLSNFRCGHDAPIYRVVEEIMKESQTPYFTFHEIDENRPSGSIKIRVETIDYFLKEYAKDKLSLQKV